MQFLKTLFWVVLAVVMVLFARDNWHVVSVNLWAGLVADIKLPVLVLFAYLVGLVPTIIVYRARITGGRLRNEVDGSTDRAEWFALPEVKKLQRVKLVDIALEMAGIA